MSDGAPPVKKKDAFVKQELVAAWRLPAYQSARLHISNIHTDVKEKQLKGILTRFGKLTQFQLTTSKTSQTVETAFLTHSATEAAARFLAGCSMYNEQLKVKVAGAGVAVGHKLQGR